MKNQSTPKHSNSKIQSRHTKPMLAAAFLLAFVMASSNTVTASASSADINQPLTKNQLSAARRGNGYAKSNKADKAQVAYQSAIDQAVSVEQCIALVKNTEHYGSVLVPVRRNCLNKAMHIVKTQDEYFQIIACARQCQLYEITKEAIDSVIAKAKDKADLLAVAHKAQSMAMNDIAHIAMDKIYTQAESLEDKIAFAKQAKLMGMEDLMRKAIKDAMDQESNAHVLCNLITAVEPLDQQDLERKILRKAVYQVKTPEDCKDVFDMAKRLGQQDIVDLAGYKGRKMILIRDAQIEQKEQRDKEEEARREEEDARREAEGIPRPSPPPPPSVDNKTPANPVPVGPGF
jgi:hypothetical protein